MWGVNLENDAKLTSYNTFTFKSEAEMLLHIKYWDEEGEKVRKELADLSQSKTKSPDLTCNAGINDL